MAIPASLTPVTVTARYTRPDGSPAAGSVRFTLSAPGQVPADGVIVPAASVKATLDGNGAIAVVLAASDDPDWGVTGLTYRVTERITDAAVRTYDVVIPAAAAGGTVNLAALAPAVSGPPVTTYETPAGAQAKADAAAAAAAATSLPLGGGTLTGPLNFGDGVSPPDVNLYRSSPGCLRTDGAYSVAGGIGVNGANPVARQVVTGSRSDGTALASLLSALALEGLITDSTTA